MSKKIIENGIVTVLFKLPKNAIKQIDQGLLTPKGTDRYINEILPYITKHAHLGAQVSLLTGRGLVFKVTHIEKPKKKRGRKKK